MLKGSIREIGTRLVALSRDLAVDTRGATAIEYGLIAALIALAVVGVVSQIGTSISAIFQNLANTLGK